MAKTKDAKDKIDLGFMLLMRYKTPVVLLDTIVQDYLPHLTQSSANRRAAKQDLPFPVFKLDGGKSSYYVNIDDVAEWLDDLHQTSRQDWQNMQAC